MKISSVKRKLEPEQPKSPPVSLEPLEDIAWELWLLIELLAPVRRRLPNTASQKLVDYVKDRLIAKSVALAKWKKARPELFPDPPIRSGRAAGRELDFPRPPELGGSDRGRTKSGHGALKGFLILCSVPRSTAKRFRFVRLGPQAIGSGKGSLEFRGVSNGHFLSVVSKRLRIRPAGAWLTGLGYDRTMDNRTKLLLDSEIMCRYGCMGTSQTGRLAGGFIRDRGASRLTPSRRALTRAARPYEGSYAGATPSP